MAMLPKRRPASKDKTPSPLDEKHRELAAQEAKLREEIERRQRLIEKAPEIAREQAKKRREELINRASRTESRPGSRVALPDRRYGDVILNAAVPARQKRLRSERNQGRLMFFTLLFLLVAVLYWAYFTFSQP